jgi:Zn-dependent M28 family amino/carboxypeptidase
VASVALAMRVEKEAVEAANVIGLVPAARGGGGAAEPRALVLTAHYDHIGVVRDADATKGEDAVYNGADDDASGVAAVIEIAEEIAAGAPPLLDVVVLLVTGEEVGLLGTEAYLDAPLVPLERTAANVNFEMVGRPDERAGGAGALWLTGFELSNLGPAFAAAGLRIGPDPRPEQQFFRRSDNFAFVRRGVVAQTLSSFALHDDYHRPSDEADKIDWAHMEASTRAAFRAARLVADGKVEPAWVGEPPAGR